MSEYQTKYNVRHIEEGTTPDGYEQHEAMVIHASVDKRFTSVELHSDGYITGGDGTYEYASFESKEDGYRFIGIDTNSDDYHSFIENIDKNYNAETVQDFLDNAPKLSNEKVIEINQQANKEIADYYIKQGANKDLVESVDYKPFKVENVGLADLASEDNKPDFTKKLGEKINDKIRENNLTVDEVLVKGSLAEEYKTNNPDTELSNKKLNSIETQVNNESGHENDWLTASKDDSFVEKVKEVEEWQKVPEKDYRNDPEYLDNVERMAKADALEKAGVPEKDYRNDPEYLDNVERMAKVDFQEKFNLDENSADKYMNTNVHAIAEKYSENGKTEIAKPGRSYTGDVIDVGEDVTVQKTKTGKFVIHETENLPGIKEEDQGIKAKIVYNAEGRGDLTKKANDLEIGKEKVVEKEHQNDRGFER